MGRAILTASQATLPDSVLSCIDKEFYIGAVPLPMLLFAKEFLGVQRALYLAENTTIEIGKESEEAPVIKGETKRARELYLSMLRINSPSGCVPVRVCGCGAQILRRTIKSCGECETTLELYDYGSKVRAYLPSGRMLNDRECLRIAGDECCQDGLMTGLKLLRVLYPPLSPWA